MSGLKGNVSDFNPTNVLQLDNTYCHSVVFPEISSVHQKVNKEQLAQTEYCLLLVSDSLNNLQCNH